MAQLSHHDVTLLLLALAVLLGAARLLGELARRVRQPAVIGEILAGVVLGPTVLGRLLPGVSASMFPQEGDLALVMHGLTTVAITLFLVVAGMEVDLGTIWRRRVAAVSVGLGGMLVPFLITAPLAYVAPRLFGAGAEQSRVVFSLFLATAMAISALPVVAKILIDLRLFRTDLGMTIIAAAVFNDLVGWIVFALVLALIGHTTGAGLTVPQTVGATLGFVLFMLTVGRWAIDRVLPWVQAHLSWPGGVLGFVLVLAIACASFTEWIGVHAIFGAFICGVALGDSRHMHARTRETIDQFVSFIFAPLFFASIGLRVDFLENFDVLLVLAVILLATVGKIAGCVAAARWAGFVRREAWAVGFGMNARGAMEIILGLLALDAGLISERLFVALVVMALVTSLTSGLLIERVLGRPKPVRFWNYAGARTFVPKLAAGDRFGAIEELARTLSDSGVDPGAVAAGAASRERVMGTGLGGGVAVPHARLPGLAQPVVAVGRAPDGIDFRAPDGTPARLVFLLVTPAEDPGAQLRLLASVAEICQSPQTVTRLLEAGSWTEVLAALNAASASAP